MFWVRVWFCAAVDSIWELTALVAWGKGKVACGLWVSPGDLLSLIGAGAAGRARACVNVLYVRWGSLFGWQIAFIGE